MRRLCIALGLLLVGVFPSTADTYLVVKVSAADYEYVFAQYLQNKSLRFENLRGPDDRRRVTIQNFDRKVMYDLDPSSRKYVERGGSPSFILSLALLLTRPPRVEHTGKTVNIYYETIDTGERKEFFGRTAKHLVIHERHVAEPGACQGSYQTEKNGWYVSRIDPLPATTITGSIVTGSFAIASNRQTLVLAPAMARQFNCSDTVVRHGDPTSPGIAVRETSDSITREILELSNAPLDKRLFEPPSGFEKVEALPGQEAISASQRMKWELAQLGQAIESWFD
jgi:hypothetical protein